MALASCSGGMPVFVSAWGEERGMGPIVQNDCLSWPFSGRHSGLGFKRAAKNIAVWSADIRLGDT